MSSWYVGLSTTGFSEAMRFNEKTAVDVHRWVEENTLGIFEPLDVLEGKVDYPESGVAIHPRSGKLIIISRRALTMVGIGDWVVKNPETGQFFSMADDDFRSEYNVWNNASSIAVHELIASLHDQWRCGELSDNYVLLELFKLLNLSRTKV